VKRYTEALDWLYGTQLFGIKPGLEPMFKMAAALGLPLGFAQGGTRDTVCFHVAGTNGKGSTCAMLASICRTAGHKTGLYTSPHLVSFRERIQINGEWIPEQAVLERLRALRLLVQSWDPHPTFFELATVLALDWFHRNGVESMVLETGLGGRMDATNVITPSVSVLTPIGLDHQKYLGNTAGEIAREKAGIIKPRTPVVSAPQTAEVREVFSEVARTHESPLCWVEQPYTAGPVGLRGEVQRWNAALAVAAVRATPLDCAAPHLAQGLACTLWPGRFEKVNADLVVDGAHNPHAAQELVNTWQEEFDSQKAHVIFGAAEDKDTAGMLQTLAPIMESLTLVPIPGNRAMPLENMQHIAREMIPSVATTTRASLEEALQGAMRGPCLITGSLFLVGEALSLLRNLRHERSLQ
jgi:dihydrofolate synthase/folylpolyglutamate synthase